MPLTKDEVAKALAEAHAQVEGTITRVVRIFSSDEWSANEPIKLLEVNTLTTASGIVPVSFGPTSDVPYPSLVVDVTPEEFKKIQDNELKLPRGWTLGDVLIAK